MKKYLVIVYSYHHNNTEKIAETMADALACEMVHLNEKSYDDILDYDVVGFGAGIDSAKHYEPLLDFARKLHPVQNKKAFIFSTSAIISEKKIRKDHTALREILLSKGYEISGEFACKGYNTNSFLRYIGGMNKNHPDVNDLQNTVVFADKLRNTISLD